MKRVRPDSVGVWLLVVGRRTPNDALQFRPHPPETPRYACHGCWRDGSGVGGVRAEV